MLHYEPWERKILKQNKKLLEGNMQRGDFDVYVLNFLQNCIGVSTGFIRLMRGRFWRLSSSYATMY